MRASKKRKQELQEQLNAAQRDSQEKDQKCSKLEDAMYDMQKKMAVSRDDYKQQQEQLLRVLEQTKRMGYARDLQISMLESDGQLMLEKCEY